MTIFRFAIIILLLCRLTFAEETVKIKLIHDTNLFETQDGQFISLSNVQTISITDSDSFRQRFAHEVFAKAKKKMVRGTFTIEISEQRDSTTLVHLWRSLPLGRESINKQFLSNGWGTFVSAPENDYSTEYEKVATATQRQKLGIYNPRQFRPVFRPSAAFWISGGLGVGVAKDHRRKSKHGTDDYLLDSSINVRNKWFVWTGGFGHSVPYGGFHEMRTWYMLGGRSFYHEFFEFVCSAGPNLNKWFYNTESPRGTIHSDWYPGAHFKVQAFAHLPVLFGLGFSFDANINKDISSYLLSLNLIWGDWEKNPNMP